MSKAYIDRINVYGFKSYGLRRLSIPVGDGFVGIVGPNGSGKSNIGDSIVFALGIASAKSMRALKLSDLIFSSKGKSAEYAEIEVVFKNLGAFPLNDEEVSIYRKVEHNGKSTYKINGRPAKQYEVEELLSMAGIPKQGYNIVTQGDIFKFIKMTPAERRDILSEIAGITDYEEKKEKALKDLEETEKKLNSAKLVLKEVKANLKRLEEERENALKALKLEEEIEKIKELIKRVKLFDLLENQEKTANKLKEIEGKLNSYYTQKESNLHRQKELLSNIKQLEQKLDELQQSLLPIKEKEGSITAKIETSKTKISEINQEISQLKENLKKLIKEKEEKFEEIKQLEEKISHIKEKLPEVETKLKEAEESLEKKNRKLKEIEIGGTKARLDLGEVEKEEKSLKDNLSNLEKKELSLNHKLEELYSKEKTYKEEIEKLQQELENLKSSKSNISQYTKTQEKKLKSLHSEINRLKIRKDALEKKLENIAKKREENFKKLTEVLVKLQHVKEDRAYTLIKNIPGVYGQVADLISVKDEELTTAIESAGGARLTNVVVENEDVAKNCIQILRKEKAGRLTFIPLNKIRVPQITKPPFRKGVIGLAINFVEYNPKIEKAIKYVFSDTVIVEDFNSAKSLGIGVFRMVSLDGDIFEKSGTISGGSSKTKATLGKGALEAEKERLEKEDDRLKTEEYEIEEELKKLANQIQEKEREIYKISVESENIIQREKDIENQITNTVNRISVLEYEVGEIKQNQINTEAKIESLKDEIKQVKKQLSLAERRKQVILEKMESQGLHQLRKEWEEATKQVYVLREEKINLESELTSLQAKLENSVKVRIYQIENEKLKTEGAIKNKETQIKELQKLIEEENQKLQKLWEGLKEKQIEKENLQNELNSLKKQLKALRFEEDNINKQITYLLEDKGKLEQKLEDIKLEIELLKEEYTGEPIKGDLKQLEKELISLENARKSIGAVNQKAVEDFEEVKRRYEDLNEKLQKLIEEKKSIEELIESLEDKKIRAFMEVYETVNKNLNKIFKQLSPGGRAYLELENEEDPLSGGVLLKAKPRGKDVKRLEIMSGGEKTLTALAFLFAVQRYKPAPFYYFDEVDAHLDDANARKIAQLMKELSKEAQFIVVTLRDTMASYADKLIGVSAREGISHVYTLDVSEILQDKEEEKEKTKV